MVSYFSFVRAFFEIELSIQFYEVFKNLEYCDLIIFQNEYLSFNISFKL
jgi:hypothetical protein